jgi:hypothetical protein
MAVPMSVQYERLRSAVNDASISRGLNFGAAAMYTMTVGVMAMAAAVPDPLKVAAIDAGARWFAGLGEGESFERARVACWKFLEDRNGSSSVVVDRTDIAVRGLICVLWDQPPEPADLETTLEYFAELADRFGGLEDALGID